MRHSRDRVSDWMLVSAYHILGSVAAVGDAVRLSYNTVRYRLRGLGIATAHHQRSRHEANRRQQVLMVLRKYGPMETFKITERLEQEGIEMTEDQVFDVIRYARIRHGSDVFRVVKWRRKRGERGRPAPSFAPGPGKDVPRPVFDQKDANRAAYKRFAERRRAREKVIRDAKGRGRPASPWDGLMATA